MTLLRSLLIGTLVGCLTGVTVALGILFVTNGHPEFKWIAPFAGALLGSLACALVTRKRDCHKIPSEPDQKDP